MFAGVSLAALLARPRSLRLKRPVDAIKEHRLGIAASPDGLDQSFSDLCRVAFVGHGAAEQLREGNAQSSRDSPQDVQRRILGAPLDPAQKLVVDITPLGQLLLSEAVLATQLFDSCSEQLQLIPPRVTHIRTVYSRLALTKGTAAGLMRSSSP